MPKQRDENKTYTEPVYHCRPTSFSDLERLINGNLRGGSRTCYTFEKWLGLLTLYERGYVKHYCKFSDQFWYEFFAEHSQHLTYSEITHAIIEDHFNKEKIRIYEQSSSSGQAGENSGEVQG